LWGSIRRSPKALVGLFLFVFFCLVAIWPSLFTSVKDPMALGTYPPGLQPSGAHLLGTTSYGQDIYAQLVYGTRESLIIALVAGAFATVLTALLVGFGLWQLYAHMQTSGFSLAGALSASLGVFAIIVVTIAVAVAQLWRRVREDLMILADVNTPPTAQAVNGATSVASAFVSGLLGSRRAKPAKAHT
jgi:ABC-type dipeptide/oligopeptide/nickel transport system permease subunit